MGLQYKRHARKMMRVRNISKAEVEACLKDYYTSYTDKKGNPIYVANVGDRRIKVVVQKENPRAVITTGD